MTEKQESILKAALMLFATQGYASTSTSKVAKAAGVSEGLIFRHFGNKEGLLNAILEMASQAMEQKMATVVMAPSPKEILTRLFEMLFSIQESEHEMWKLVYALKWQTDSYDESKYASLKLVLSNAFEKLGYEDPAAETELVFMIMDGVATSFLLHPPENKSDILKALKIKYEL
ncbi:TetR/AcrR family transcriptional regulator [Flavobacteriales bacterium]|nr:TetR/AcrR family transcriptional regulator [Flavobacteriales bacterium]